MEPVTTPGPDAERLQRARRRLIARRFPRLSVVWLLSSIVWLAAVVAEGLLDPPHATAVIAGQAVILFAALVLCGKEPESPRTLAVAMAACVLLGVTSVALFAAIGAGGDFVAFVLLMLYLLTALAFSWGWKAEAVLLLLTVVPWTLAIPALRFSVPTAELIAAIVVGSAIAIAVAEGTARAFAVAFEHREADEASRRALEAVVEREQAARRDAERAARTRDEFLAMLSHELRSPLGAILTWTRMLRRGQLDAERIPNALASVEEAARAQERLVGDLLDISRIAAGKFALKREPVELGPLLEARVEAARASIAEKGVTLAARLDPLGATVRADPMRLQQVFENLLSNAVKFTPAGGRIDVALARRGADVEVSVSDTGIGIAPEILPHVFEAFQQADRSITRRYGGLGLGLAIARRLIEAHGGRIDAESAGEGTGATFRVRLPRVEREVDAVRAPHGTPAVAAADLKDLRVLVVEDDPRAREMVTTLLAHYGARVRPAGSVPEAMQTVLDERPDVVVADIAMPGEDGYSLVRRLRALEDPARGRLPIIAVTALASAEDRQRAIGSGFDEHLAKPVDPAELLDVVARSAATAR